MADLGECRRLWAPTPPPKRISMAQSAVQPNAPGPGLHSQWGTRLTRRSFEGKLAHRIRLTDRPQGSLPRGTPPSEPPPRGFPTHGTPPHRAANLEQIR